MTAMNWSIFAIFLISLALSKNVTSPAKSSSPPCLPRFFSHRQEYEVCLKHPCFLFLNQPPFVILDPDMSGIESQRPFPCKNRKELYPNLNGISFQIHQEIEFKAYCMFGGSECSFNEMTKFASDRAKDPTTNKYIFGAQGMVAQLPKRITSTLETSVTISRDPFILIKSIHGDVTGEATFNLVFRAFERATWISLFVFFMFLVFMASLVTYIFTGSISPLTVLQTMMIENSDDQQLPESKKRLRTTAKALVVIMFSTFFVLSKYLFFPFIRSGLENELLTILEGVVFYEIGIVNFIFDPQAETLPKPLSNFTNDELKAFGVQTNSATESSLLGAVESEEKRFASQSEYPWVRCRQWDECYKKLLNPKDSLHYMIVYKPEAMHEIKNRLACSKVMVVDTSDPDLSFPGSTGLPYGWYLSSAASDEILVKMNKELLKLQDNGILTSMVSRATDAGGNCGVQKLSIAPGVIMLPLLFTLLPICLFTSALILIHILKKTNNPKETMNDRDDVLIGPDFTKTGSFSSYMRFWSTVKN